MAVQYCSRLQKDTGGIAALEERRQNTGQNIVAPPGNCDDRAIRKRFSPKSVLFMVYRLACQSRIEADLIDHLCSVLSTFED
jgi:hypothetical protein